MSGLSPSDAILRYDYSLRDVYRIGRHAAAHVRRMSGSAGDYGYWIDVAVSAIAEVIYSSEVRPSEFALLMAGRDAAFDEVRDYKRHRGLGRDNEVRPKYAAYWLEHSISHFPEDRIIDRMALVEILPLLSAVQCQTLLAMAASGSEAATASLLGIPKGTVKSRLNSARRVIAEWWHEGETPRSATASSTTCRYGHPKVEYWSVDGDAHYCRKCRSDYRRRRRAQGLVA